MEGGRYSRTSPTLLPLFLQNMKKYTIIINQEKVDIYNKKYQEEHPRAKNLAIKAPQHPSLNTYIGMSNMGKNTLKSKWEDFIIWILKEENLLNVNISKCEIHYHTCFKHNHRHDLDNITPKFIFDGFVKGGFIVDDNSDHIVSLTTTCEVDKDNPRIEITVNVLE